MSGARVWAGSCPHCGERFGIANVPGEVPEPLPLWVSCPECPGNVVLLRDGTFFDPVEEGAQRAMVDQLDPTLRRAWDALLELAGAHP